MAEIGLQQLADAPDVGRREPDFPDTQLES
jgi:hypothetical protein